MTIREAAREYLALGFSVIPIQPGKKIPSMKWEEFQRRLMTSDEVDIYFKDSSNIALVCGEISGVLVIDQDSYKKKTGGSKEPLRSPLMVVTPRGGTHVYYAYREGTVNTVNHELAIDIRSNGGYVLLPPSTVVQEDGSGMPYLWTVTPTKELISSLPQAPTGVLEDVYRTGMNKTVGPLSSSFDMRSAFNIQEGGRNDTLHRLALSELNKFGGNESSAWQSVAFANSTAQPPLGENELKLLFLSAVKRYNQVPPMHYSIKKNKVFLEVAENKTYERKSLKRQLDSVISQLLDGKQTGISTGFPKLDSIMGGFLPGQSYLLFADTGVGKSMFSVNILASLAKRGVKCLYFDLENDMQMSLQRLMFAAHEGKMTIQKWRNVNSKEDRHEKEALFREMFSVVDELLDNVHIWDIGELHERFGDITWEGVKRCIDEGVKEGVQVVVVDHLHYFSPVETDHAVLGEIARQMNNICSINNISVLLVAHTKKGLVHARKDGLLSITRPTVDDINGSGMIAKHFKNIMALSRNASSADPYERCDTDVYVDKTKYGPSDSFKMVYNENSLIFVDPTVSPSIEEFHKKNNAALFSSRKEPEVNDRVSCLEGEFGVATAGSNMSEAVSVSESIQVSLSGEKQKISLLKPKIVTSESSTIDEFEILEIDPMDIPF